MPDHYFSQNPQAAHAKLQFTHTFANRVLHFETDAGVFSREHMDKGTALLLDALPETCSGRVLDLGCGWGAVGVCMAAMWPDANIVMTDINERAALLAQRNIEQNGLRADVLCGDGIAHIDGSFDLIALNPPIRAGKQVIYGLFEAALERLTENGSLYVVIRKQQGAESAKKFLAERAEVSTVARGGGFHVLRVRV